MRWPLDARCNGLGAVGGYRATLPALAKCQVLSGRNLGIIRGLSGVGLGAAQFFYAAISGFFQVCDQHISTSIKRCFLSRFVALYCKAMRGIASVCGSCWVLICIVNKNPTPKNH